MSIQFLGMIGHRLSSETIAPAGPVLTATISCALRKLTKRPASIACWWGIGPISRMAFWLPRWRDYRQRKSVSCWPIARIRLANAGGT